MKVRLTDRDRKIIRDIWLFRYSNAEQLCRLHFSSIKVAQRRLRKLSEAGYIDRFSPRRGQREGFHPWWYRLGRKGAELLVPDLGRPAKDLMPPKRTPRGLRFLDHHSGVIDFRVWLRLGVRATAGEFRCRFVPEYEELAGDGNRISIGLSTGAVVRPDGAVCLERRDGRAALLILELDRGTEPLSGRPENSITSKLRRYRLLFDSSADRHYWQLFSRQFRAFRCLFVVTDATRAEGVRRCAEAARLDPLIWIAVATEVSRSLDLNDPIWETGSGRRLPLVA